jgi:hypothetical protein
MTSKNLRQRVAAGLMCLSLTGFASLAVNLRISTTLLKVEIGEAANAQRRSSKVGEVLKFVFGEVIQAGTSWALDNAANAFKPQEQSVAPATNSSSTYIGSSFVAMVNYRGRTLRGDYFATSSGAWYMWHSRDQKWFSISAPAFQVYRAADIYRNSSGGLFSLTLN